jgi:hypothetical protein
MQPAYLPWLGFFHRISLCDLFIVLDHVEIDLNSRTKFANRNRIRTSQGWQWLTVPIKTKGLRGQLRLSDIEINNDEKWPGRHLNSLRLSYARAPHFADYIGLFESLYEAEWRRLAELTRASTDRLLSAIGLSTPLLYSSQMNVEGRKSALILNLCRLVGAHEYVSGPFGRTYLDADEFRNAGIALKFHDYRHPEYRQMFEPFEPYMAAIDLLFNHGPKSLAILSEGQALASE